MSKYSGACHCGEIRYCLNSEIPNVVNCHCDFCRSHSGAAFSTYAALPYRSLKISKGREKLSCYEKDGGKKYFCSCCGTPIFNVNRKYPGACMVYFGTLDYPRDITPMINIWCESKLEWVDDVPSIRSVDKGIERE